MAKKLGAFAFVGIRNMKIFDNTNQLVTMLKHLKDIDISNESSTSYLRGGEGNKKLLAIAGDASATITANNATVTTKLWEIITGNVVTEEQRKVQIDKVYTVSGTTVALTPVPSTAATFNVFLVDEDGRDSTKLTVGNPSTNSNEFSVSGSTLTFNTDKGGKKVHIYYPTDKTTTVVTAKPNMAKNFRFEADLLCKDVETKEAFIAKLIIGNGKIQEQFSMTTANDAQEPAAIPLAIDCLEDSATGKFYEILFYDDEVQA